MDDIIALIVVDDDRSLRFGFALNKVDFGGTHKLSTWTLSKERNEPHYFFFVIWYIN